MSPHLNPEYWARRTRGGVGGTQGSELIPGQWNEPGAGCPSPDQVGGKCARLQRGPKES